ncbi:MAG: acyl-CoA synthetase [Bacteroidetes bacterium]|jgi:fatty-acyl-CoA synthase|nr:acyl-CoA synthetase [Bacteroidota bacterium]
MSTATNLSEGIATQADVEAIEQVPLRERNLPESTYAMLRQGAARHPEKTALQFFLRGAAYERSDDYSFEELVGRITQAANLFHALGVGRGDVVSYLLPNLPDTHAVLWGAEAAGIANPINPLLDAEAIADLMRAAETKVLVTLAPFPGTNLWEKVARIQNQVPSLETILQVDLARHLSGLRRAGVKLWRWGRASAPSPQGGPRVEPFHPHLDAQPNDRRVSDRQIHPDDIASLFHTGGTTGRPKLAARTHRNEVFDAWAGVTVAGVRSKTTILCGLPLFHAHAALILGLAPWSQGASVVLATPKGFRDPDVIPKFWRIVDHYGVTAFSGVPTVFSALLDVPSSAAAASSVEFAFSGAAPLPVEVYRRFRNETGIPILEGYGLTEGTCVSSVMPRRGEHRPGSVGLRLPYQEMAVALLDDDGVFQRWCDAGEVGVLLIRGPNVFEGYRDAAHNADAWVEASDGGLWLNTGDLGRQDEDGYFWIDGRKKDLIIRSGHNLDPKEVEEALHEHPAVEIAAVVGRPDAYAGELPVAFVQLRPAAHATEDELLAHAEARVTERPAVPKHVRIVDTMPQTAVGKVFKPELRHREIADVYREAVTEAQGVETADVAVSPDSSGAVHVQIHVTKMPRISPDTLQSNVRDALAHFTTPYNLIIQE